MEQRVASLVCWRYASRISRRTWHARTQMENQQPPSTRGCPKRISKEIEIERAAKVQDVGFKTREFKGLDADAHELTGDRSTVQVELDATNEALADDNDTDDNDTDGDDNDTDKDDAE